MSRRGNCWDAVAESFCSSLKKEQIRKHIAGSAQRCLKPHQTWHKGVRKTQKVYTL